MKAWWNISTTDAETSKPCAVGFADSKRILVLLKQGLVLPETTKLGPYVKVYRTMILILRPDEIVLDYPV